MTTHESFLADVKNHSMTIENDNGLFRSVFFGVKGSCNQHFRLVTWPGHLAISGDMGDFVFARTTDMFEFFGGECGSINPSYWGEKLQAVSVFGGYKKFDWDAFVEDLVHTLHTFNDHHSLESIRATVEELCDSIENDEPGAIGLIRDWDDDETELYLDPCDLGQSKKHTYQYIWCLYAIVWGISQYIDATQGAAEQGSDV